MFFERMVRERLLDAACLVMGARESGRFFQPPVKNDASIP
ncbi:MAG: hypothetical protein IPG03_07795 [Candidatus Microthrix sp.]|nr:hypothetical protein [Candidatus Microthrix sp.]